MKLRRGDMFKDSKDPVLLITGNSTIKKDGSLVMGRGAALQAARKWIGIDVEMGSMVKDAMNARGVYGTVIGYKHHGPFKSVGMFQVKQHFRDDADLMLISHSCMILNELLESKSMRGLSVSMNFPGIGAGRLRREDVMYVLTSKYMALPDSVTVWEHLSDRH